MLLWSECAPPPPFLSLKLPTKVIVLGGEAFRRWLGHERGLSSTGLVPYKRGPRRVPLSSSTTLGYRKSAAPQKKDITQPSWHPDRSLCLKLQPATWTHTLTHLIFLHSTYYCVLFFTVNHSLTRMEAPRGQELVRLVLLHSQCLERWLTCSIIWKSQYLAMRHLSISIQF